MTPFRSEVPYRPRRRELTPVCPRSGRGQRIEVAGGVPEPGEDVHEAADVGGVRAVTAPAGALDPVGPSRHATLGHATIPQCSQTGTERL